MQTFNKRITCDKEEGPLKRRHRGVLPKDPGPFTCPGKGKPFPGGEKSYSVEAKRKPREFDLMGTGRDEKKIIPSVHPRKKMPLLDPFFSLGIERIFSNRTLFIGKTLTPLRVENAMPSFKRGKMALVISNRRRVQPPWSVKGFCGKGGLTQPIKKSASR